ncbi:MAG: serine/threonine-protein kinase [Planctomycetota bacterium]|nr:serine/threonine-protein kinase [Planctomycetota bacterium]
MTSSNRARAREIFLEVCDLSGAAQAQRLDELCRGDTSLRLLVEAMLREDPGEGGTFVPLVNAVDATDLAAAILEAPGTMIGPYRIVRQLGEGGFGTVFLAQQDVPIKREVALKVIKLGMDTRQVVARFEAERQALALMDHPGIAKVHDAGATPNGRPYFVMELCSGLAITEYCDRERLSLRARLSLFVQVCQAVQHAHQKGLIHRDIKPSNVLVSTVDGQPLAKIIDFGIAKATQARLAEKTAFTEQRQLVGTPEYMSPEQAEGSLDIDTRSDVYSLGVLLYSLLTGSTPFDSRELRSAAYAEIQRIIREVEPPRPSTRLSQATETIASIAANRGTEPRRLGSTLRGELDWIVMKALEKPRGRRYASAAEFAVDIERYLRDEPVQARPTSAMYRTWKFARRNKVVVVAAGAVALSLLAGLAATTVMYLKADEARLSEQAQRRVAETKSATAQAINDFLTQDILVTANPWDGEGRHVTVAQVLERAGDKVRTRFEGQPQVEAAVQTTLGESFRSLGLFKEAQPHYDRALELHRSIPAGDPDVAVDEADVAEALRMQAANMQANGQFNEAEPICRDALARHTRLFGEDSVQVADTLEVLADIQRQSHFDDAAKSLEQVIRIREPFAAAGTPMDGVALARATSTLGSSLNALGKFPEAKEQKLKAVEMFKKAVGEKSPYVAQTLSDLGSLCFEVDKFEESEQYFNQSLPLLTELLGPEHSAVLTTRRSLANTLSLLGKNDQAEPMLREVIATSERVLGEGHPDTMACINSLATLMLRNKRHPEAEPLLTSLYDRSVKAFGPEHAETLKYASNLAWCLIKISKQDLAEKHFRIAVEGFEKTLGRLHPYSIATKDSLAQCLAIREKWIEAASYDKLVIDLSKESGEAESEDTARILGRQGNNLLRGGDYAGARDPLTRSLELSRKFFPPADWRTGTAEWRLGDCLSHLGLKAEAEASLLAGVKKLREDSTAPAGTLKPGLEKLAEHYERTGQADRAAPIRDELKPPVK